MIARLFSATVFGVDAVEIAVEVDARPGNERTLIVGLPDAAVKESSQRVSSAIANSGLARWDGILTVNLAPADLRKQGPSFDLPIALGMVSAALEKTVPDAQSWCIVGELALDGAVRPIRGALSVAIAAREHGRRNLILPTENATEASVIEGVNVYPVGSLQEAWDLLLGQSQVLPFQKSVAEQAMPELYKQVDFADVRGQYFARRALEIAAVGGHNVLLSGSPGSGKSMLAQRLPTILPEMNEREAIETTKIYSVCGLLKKGEGLVKVRPFRAPHHTISGAGMLGGGAIPTPGEISLAHNGVLFLDELPEFQHNTLESLRQPLEDEIVQISRAAGSMVFPARFTLIGAMNPCPCGFYGDSKRSCRCGPRQIDSYRQRLSGPLLDRFDLLLDVPSVEFKELSSGALGESSAEIRLRVTAARKIQQARFARAKGVTTNSSMTPSLVRQHCQLDLAGTQSLERAMTSLQLSARAYNRILKVARTIADLEQSESIHSQHIYEAVQFRKLDQTLKT